MFLFYLQQVDVVLLASRLSQLTTHSLMAATASTAISVGRQQPG
jgi:hypothetical protein